VRPLPELGLQLETNKSGEGLFIIFIKGQIMPKLKIILLALNLVLLGSCQTRIRTSSLPPSLESRQGQILISEVFTGEEGNNQADFIELYNTGTQIADLKGFSLWYRLTADSEEILVHRWTETALIPPLGYYALALEGQHFSEVPDASFSQPLVPNRGGLSLREGDQVEDQLAWGSGPASMAESNPASALLPGYSLARCWGPNTDKNADTNDNLVDFSLNPTPNLQNTGSLINHDSALALNYTIEFPPVIQPGILFDARFIIQNRTNQTLENLWFTLPLPDVFTLQESAGYQLEGSQLSWKISSLADGETFIGTIPLQAAVTYADFSIHNSYMKAENWPMPVFTSPFYGKIGGGAIPIATARTLVDKEVLVEGISTMYVGGFYAGSGANFYLQDETGGIQIYAAGAGSSLQVPIGAKVRVKGKIEIYRDSLELIPASEEFVEILEGPAETPDQPPEAILIKTITEQSDYLPGRLVVVEGWVARIEEFAYSFEIDLFDDSGNLVSLYIDKETGITIEEIEADQFYRVTGIMELFDGNLRLYPRIQSDISRVYPAGLTIQAEAPTTVNPEGVFQVSFSVSNHDPLPDSNLIISAPLDPHLDIIQIQDGGVLENNTIRWQLTELAGQGASITIGFKARIITGSEYVRYANFGISSDNWPDPTGGNTSYTFTGDSVPIWAIQGSGDRSPYILAKLTTVGVVTGVFPELEGFWIQEPVSDDDPATSPGLFISSEPDLPEVSPGDLVAVTGLVRESFQQTQLEISSPSDVTVLGKHKLPDPVFLDPPANDAESKRYYESLEGVLASVPGPALVVGPSTRYGEFALVLPKYGISRTWQDQDHGMLIHVDDGSNLTHETRDTLPEAVAVGDLVSLVTGPLAYSFGNYKIEPTSRFSIQSQPPEINSFKPIGEGYFSIMTWNVENLFDFVVPHPSDPPLPSVSEYHTDISRIARTIQAAGLPTVIGLQEVENISILEDIAADPLLQDYLYLPILIEGSDSRGINVGYLVRSDRAVVLDQVQYTAPGNITSRPPLLVKIQLASEPTPDLYILNNHFTSLSGGEQATEPRRNAQAAWNLQIAQGLENSDPSAWLVILGDLNSYYNSLPLITLQEGGFINVFDSIDPEERYTYVYQGISQVLDYILVNKALEGYLVRVDVLHCNADYPLPLSAGNGFLHQSDHDPVIATFLLPE